MTVCGKWGMASFFKDDFPTYCNREIDHDGPCSYENSRGNVFELSALEEQPSTNGVEANRDV